MELIRISIKLFFNGLRYKVYRFTGHASKINAISLEVTRRCIAKCIMCNIWKTPSNSPELTTYQWLHLLSSPSLKDLREVDITGGEPFLRKDLTGLLMGILNLKSTQLKSLRSIAITTNGFLTEEIISVLSNIASFAKDANVEMVIVFAMDGIGPTHERIRRVKGGWQLLHHSIQEVRGLRERFENIIIGLKTTVLPENVEELDAIADYAKDNGLFTIISPFIITQNRYNNAELKDIIHFSPKQLIKMMEFYEGDNFLWGYHRMMLLSFFRHGKTLKPCSAGFNYFFVRSDGNLFPCPLIKKGMGNVVNTPLDKLVHSLDAKDFRRKVGRYPECLSCTEPGLERCALPFEGFHFLGLMGKVGRKGFLDLYHHMGLDKYL